MLESDYTSIKFKKSTKARLRHYLHMHELDSLDAAINRLLDHSEGKI